MEHCYLLHEERHYNVNRPTLKLGRTKNIINRFKAPNYKKANIIAVISVQNSAEIEKRLKNAFKEKFLKDSEYGSEYFSGDINAMRSEFLRIIQESEIPAIQLPDTPTPLSPDTNIEDEICRLNSIIYDEPTIPTYQEGNNSHYIVKSFRMASKLNPIDIIITDRNTQEGYIVFTKSHNGWYKIWDKDSTDKDAETLQGWLECNLRTSSFFSRDEFRTDIILELSRLDFFKYFFTFVEYDINAIIDDLVTHYYDPNPAFLQEAHYGQYFTGVSAGRCLVDLRTLTCQLANSIERPRFPAHRGFQFSYPSNLLNLKEVDEKIVQELLCLLYKDKNLVSSFRKFCYSVLVEPTIDILDLTEEKTGNRQLVAFIKDTLKRLNREEDYLLLGPGTDNNETLTQAYIKKLLLNNPNNRLWIVYMTTKGKVSKEQLVNNFKKFNIKNVLLVPYKKNNRFGEKDEQVMRKFVKENVSSLSEKEMEREEGIRLYIDEIFDSNRDGYLTTHFLKWCATS